MTNMLRDKATVNQDADSYVLDMLLKSDMAKAFPSLAAKIASSPIGDKNRDHSSSSRN
jgi:hypothetical protein